MSDTIEVPQYIFDPTLEPFRPQEGVIADVMLQAVGKHAVAGADKFSTLNHDAKEYPFQRADCIAVIGKAATQGDMVKLAPLVYTSFEKLVDRILTARGDMLSASAGALENGHDITIATDHRQIIGLAVAACAYTAALYESGNVKHGDINTEIIVSEMLKYTRVIGLPAVSLLHGVFSRTRFVVPAANRANKQQLPKGYAEAANIASVASRSEDTGKPKITAVAMSATGDVYSPTRRFGKYKRKKGFYMAPPTDGTIQEYAVNKYTLPMSVDMAMPDATFMGKLHRNTQVKTPADVYAIMKEIADGITEASGITSVFEPDMEKFQGIKLDVENHHRIADRRG